jgi:hypothetical protein
MRSRLKIIDGISGGFRQRNVIAQIGRHATAIASEFSRRHNALRWAGHGQNASPKALAMQRDEETP